MSEPVRDEEELRAVLTGLTSRDVGELDLDQDLVRELGLDSLAGLRLLAHVEKRFDVRFPDDQLSEFRTMKDLLGVIRAGEKEDGS